MQVSPTSFHYNGDAISPLSNKENNQNAEESPPGSPTTKDKIISFSPSRVKRQAPFSDPRLAMASKCRKISRLSTPESMQAVSSTVRKLFFSINHREEEQSPLQPPLKLLQSPLTSLQPPLTPPKKRHEQNNSDAISPLSSKENNPHASEFPAKVYPVSPERKRKATPQPPRKPQIKRYRQDECPVEKKSQEIRTRELRWRGCTLILTPTNQKGRYHGIHKIKEMIGAPHSDVFKEWKPTQCVIKSMHEDSLEETSGVSNPTKKRKLIFKNSWEQRQQLKESGFAVIPVLNYPPEDGFWLVPEVVPGCPSTPQEGDLNAEQIDLMEQVARICDKAIEENINIDLQRSNLYRQPNGLYAFLDFREVSDEGDVKIDIRKQLKDFHHGNKEALKILKQSERLNRLLSV